jgi:hypothetical protein
VKINNIDTCCEWVEEVRTTKRNKYTDRGMKNGNSETALIFAD